MTALAFLIRLLLDAPDIDIREWDSEVIICRHCPGHCPEDYISVKDMQGNYAICEAHRDKEVVRAWAGDVEEASVLAAALGGRMLHIGANLDAVWQIRGYAAQGHEDQAARFLAGLLDRAMYCIGEEDPSRVSLVKKGRMADVRFARRNLVEGASLPRAYAVLYNYGKMLGEAHSLCQKAWEMGLETDTEKVLGLYLFGDQEQSRKI